MSSHWTFDGPLVAWALWVIGAGASAAVTICTIVLLVLRIVIAVRELRK